MNTYIIVFVFLAGFVFAMFLVWQSLPFMLKFLDRMSEIEKGASYLEGQNEVLGKMLSYQMGQTNALITGLVEVAKVSTPLPYPPLPVQNVENTLTHSLTHSNNVPNVPEEKPLKFIVRKSAMNKGKFEGNMKTVYFQNLKGERFSVEVEKGKLVEFGSEKVWAGICLHCENRFGTAKQETQFCCASCNQNFNHGKV